MEDCDVITEIPFEIKILLSFFKRGSESKLYISSECQKVEVRARKSAVLLSDPRLKKLNKILCRVGDLPGKLCFQTPASIARW